MSSPRDDALEELIAERDTLKRRIAAALREEKTESYAAMGIGSAFIALVLAGAVTGELSWELAAVIAVFAGIATAVAVVLIRAYGLSTVLNIFTTPSPDFPPETDDPLDDLRRRLAECDQRIAQLRRKPT